MLEGEEKEKSDPGKCFDKDTFVKDEKKSAIHLIVSSDILITSSTHTRQKYKIFQGLLEEIKPRKQKQREGVPPKVINDYENDSR